MIVFSSAARKGKPGSFLKENENLDFVTNPYQAIVLARDSLKQREEEQMMLAEIHKLDAEVEEIRKMNDEEKLIIQDLEMQLIKRRRRVEKCRRLAESQSSYRSILEKMIRDAMHQSVVYKEQVRLNQAATNALMARLEAQKAICDSSEKVLHTKFKQRDELEKQIRPELEQVRKRSRIDSAFIGEQEDKTVLYLPGTKTTKTTPSHKQLRMFLEEEHKASEVEIEEENELKEHDKVIVALENEITIEDKMKELGIRKEKRHMIRTQQLDGDEEEEDEESRKERGKGNVERWLKFLLEDCQHVKDLDELNDNTAKIDESIAKMNDKSPQKDSQHVTEPDEVNDHTAKIDESVTKMNDKSPQKDCQHVPEPDNMNGSSKIDDMITKMNEKFPQKEAKEHVQDPPQKEAKECVQEIAEVVETSKTLSREGSELNGDRKSCEYDKRKGRGLARSDSARTLRRIPSSPLIIGMKKGVECMLRKKPNVIGDDEDYLYNEDIENGNSFLNKVKKVVKV